MLHVCTVTSSSGSPPHVSHSINSMFCYYSAKPNESLKLMLVGLQRMGKTTLLSRLKEVNETITSATTFTQRVGDAPLTASLMLKGGKRNKGGVFVCVHSVILLRMMLRFSGAYESDQTAMSFVMIWESMFIDSTSCCCQLFTYFCELVSV